MYVIKENDLRIYMNTTKRVKTIVQLKYLNNEYLQAIITTRMWLRWVKREEDCEMSD